MNEIGVCIRDKSGSVVFQNAPCQLLCGNKRDKICQEGCMAYYRKSCRSKKTQYVANAVVDEAPFDLLFVEDKNSLTTLLVPISDQYQEDRLYLQKRGLTKSELQIALLICRGRTNSQIRDELHISPSTLRTHLTHIYSKLDREFLNSRRNFLAVGKD